MELCKTVLSSSDEDELVGKLNHPLAPGEYVVNWRAVSVDTHKTPGQYPFHVGLEGLAGDYTRVGPVCGFSLPYPSFDS